MRKLLPSKVVSDKLVVIKPFMVLTSWLTHTSAQFFLPHDLVVTVTLCVHTTGMYVEYLSIPPNFWLKMYVGASWGRMERAEDHNS